MDIQRAKEEIKQTVRAYLACDDTGAPLIPPVRQRPILLMGPPGVGKTQIMEQIAQECGIALVAYTITHHTRQSAVGLPFYPGTQLRGQDPQRDRVHDERDHRQRVRRYGAHRQTERHFVY